MIAYTAWPFWPENRSDDQTQRWWRECYHEAPADRQLRGVYHWFLLSGGPGSGKSVALRAWQMREAADSLIIPYPPEFWPGSPAAWFPDNPSHLAQMMAIAGKTIGERLHGQPELIPALDSFQREFLRALFEYMGGPRHYRRFVAGLPQEHAEGLLNVPVEIDFFEDGNSFRGVQAQIDELVQLVRGLGRERIVFTIDPPTPLNHTHNERLADLFGWLDLADHPGFAVAVVAPDAMLEAGSTLARARGRAGLIYTDWTEDECRAVAERHLILACGDPACGLSYFLSPKAQDQIGATLAHEYGRPSPAGWVNMAETILYVAGRPAHPLPLPFENEESLRELRVAYFTRHVKLCLDPSQQVVWRGPRKIELTPKPFEFIELLLRRGRPVNWDDPELRLLGSTPGNVYKIASRVRQEIEPVPKTPVYLHSDSSIEGGYKLENCVLLSEGATRMSGS
jgi:hypothetical protein